jgi:hypothetical protein
MKFINLRFIFYFSLIYFLVNIFSSVSNIPIKYNRNIQTDDSSTDIDTLIVTVNKYNKTITKQQQIIEKLKDYAQGLEDENKNLKEQKNISPTTTSNNPNEGNKQTSQYPITPDLKESFNRYFEFESIYKQIELQISREKELRDTVNQKLNEVKSVQDKINKMYQEINTDVKQKVNDLDTKYKSIEKSNYEINQRVFILEKEKEKTEISRKLTKDGISYKEDRNVIEADCVNRSSCRVCLDDPKCVWCSIDKKCKLGDMAGPYDGSCNNSFEYSSCSQSLCNSFNSCFECIENESCGWCGNNIGNKCVDGNEKKPISFTCDNYIHKFSSNNRCYIHNTNKFLF